MRTALNPFRVLSGPLAWVAVFIAGPLVIAGAISGVLDRDDGPLPTTTTTTAPTTTTTTVEEHRDNLMTALERAQARQRAKDARTDE